MYGNAVVSAGAPTWCVSQAGMHASISAHIAREYLLDEAAGRWGPNLALFAERLGNEARKEHVENLYFAYLFVLRAVRKAGPALERMAFETGMPEADARTQALVGELVRALCRMHARLACREKSHQELSAALAE